MNYTVAVVLMPAYIVLVPLAFWLGYCLGWCTDPRRLLWQLLGAALVLKRTLKELRQLLGQYTVNQHLLDQVPPVGGAPGHSSPAGSARSGVFSRD